MTEPRRKPCSYHSNEGSSACIPDDSKKRSLDFAKVGRMRLAMVALSLAAVEGEGEWEWEGEGEGEMRPAEAGRPGEGEAEGLERRETWGDAPLSLAPRETSRSRLRSLG